MMLFQKIVSPQPQIMTFATVLLRIIHFFLRFFLRSDESMDFIPLEVGSSFFTGIYVFFTLLPTPYVIASAEQNIQGIYTGYDLKKTHNFIVPFSGTYFISHIYIY